MITKTEKGFFSSFKKALFSQSQENKDVNSISYNIIFSQEKGYLALII